MRILVDADACPGRNIIEQVAKKYKIDVMMFCDINHVINSNYSIIKYVDHGFIALAFFPRAIAATPKS